MSLVMKFGGTSVGSSAAMRQAASLVERALPRAPLVVSSAMAGVTNALIEAARAAEQGDQATVRRVQKRIVEQHDRCVAELFPDGEPAELEQAVAAIVDELKVMLRGVFLLRELSPRSLDAISGVGERLSTRILAALLVQRGVDAEWMDARGLIRTDRRFGAARPDAEAIARLVAERLAPRLAAGRTVVTQGFIGATEDGLSTTLGRGGSDFSAALFGAALPAEEVQIWTDVEGMLTCDPRVVPNARPIPDISFDEAAELAAFGAKVLHPATIQPAVQADVPVTVRHSGRPEGAFTTITAKAPTRRAVTALASRGPVTVLTVHTPRMLAQSGFLGRLFEIFARLDTSVDLVATAEVSVSLTVEADAPLAAIEAEINRFARVVSEPGRAIVAVVGERIRTTKGLAKRIFSALSCVNVELITMGANEINLSVLVKMDEAPEALRALHRELFEEQPA